MAVDSAAKRRSAAGAGLFILGPGVTPSASSNAAWRYAAAYGYSGLVEEAGGGEDVFVTPTSADAVASAISPTVVAGSLVVAPAAAVAAAVAQVGAVAISGIAPAVARCSASIGAIIGGLNAMASWITVARRRHRR